MEQTPEEAKTVKAEKTAKAAKAVRVVAALIEKDHKILICRRPPHKKRGGLWEFVGGKVEEGETDGEALRRECREELNVGIGVGELFHAVTHDYPDLTVELCVYRAEILSGTPELLEHTEIRFVSKEELDAFDFCSADETVLEKIKKEF